MDSARRDDFISGFKQFDHFLVFFLFHALGPDEQKVENNEDEDKRDHSS
jgi:tRNA (Thr-GGU) A37 N-methylase